MDNQKLNALALEPKLKQALSQKSADSNGVTCSCELVDAFRGARVAPELTSKIIMLQKAIESGIVSPESSVKDLSDELKAETGVNPADYLDAFKDILKKNDVSITELGKSALIQKAAASLGLETSAFSTLLDLQNGLCSAGFSKAEIATILSELVKDVADFAALSKTMMTALDNQNRLKDEELALTCKIGDAIDKSAAKSSKLSKLLTNTDLKALPDLVEFLRQNMGVNAESLAKALAVQTLMSASNCEADKLARGLRIEKALVKNGVPKSTISRLIQEALEDNPGARKLAAEEVRKSLNDLQKLLQNGDYVEFMARYTAAMTEACSSVDNLKEIFENAMNVVGLTREDVAR